MAGDIRMSPNGERIMLLPGIPWPVLPGLRAWLVPGTRGIVAGSRLEQAEVFVDGVRAQVVRREAERLEFIAPDVRPAERCTLTTTIPQDLFQPRRVQCNLRAAAPSFWTWNDHWPEVRDRPGLYPWALHEDGGRLITPEDPVLPGEWSAVQLTGVRLEDAPRLRWVWRKVLSDPFQELEAGGIRPDPDLEGLLRVKLKMPMFEPAWEISVGVSLPEKEAAGFTSLPAGGPPIQP